VILSRAAHQEYDGLSLVHNQELKEKVEEFMVERLRLLKI
jgi:hypothetical protein